MLKVRIDWGEQNENGTYDVDGACLDEVLSELERRSEWATFRWFIGHRANWTGSEANVVEVVLEPSYRITMPNWTASARSKGVCIANWERAMRALRKHEEGHRDLFFEQVKSAASALRAKPRLSTSKVAEWVDDLKRTIDREQAAYDKKTDHGRASGVTLDVPPECRCTKD